MDSRHPSHGHGHRPSPRPIRHRYKQRYALWLAAALALAAQTACEDATAPPRDAETTTVLQWNELVRELVIIDRTSPPVASRAYAYLSVAQYAAALAARGFYQDVFASTQRVNPDPGRVEAAIAAASAQALSLLFPAHEARIAHELQTNLAGLRARSAAPSAIASGEEIGNAVATGLATRAAADGANLQWTGSAPNGSGFWTGTSPQLPAWGLVRPWLWEAAGELRAPPPPAFESEAFRAALAEVRGISDTRTPEQLEIARFWADGAGTYTPPGHWNELAADLIRSSEMGELHAARVMALTNMAMADGMIGCWDSKFAYWVIRPYQADAGISTPIGQPPHPSYPSGHACSSSAAAEVLAALFPARASELKAMATEACDSRVYAGIHYRFDAKAGSEIGEKTGTRALERGDAFVGEIVRALARRAE